MCGYCATVARPARHSKASAAAHLPAHTGSSLDVVPMSSRIQQNLLGAALRGGCQGAMGQTCRPGVKLLCRAASPSLASRLRRSACCTDANLWHVMKPLMLVNGSLNFSLSSSDNDIAAFRPGNQRDAARDDAGAHRRCCLAEGIFTPACCHICIYKSTEGWDEEIKALKHPWFGFQPIMLQPLLMQHRVSRAAFICI